MTSTTDQEVFQVRANLYSPARFPPKVYELYRTRALVTDAIVHQCWLMILVITKTHLVGRAADATVPRVGILGGGHMGCAIAMSLLKNDYPVDRIAISTRQPDRLPRCAALSTLPLQTRFQTISRYHDNTRLSKESDILVLCMPPSQLKSVAIQIKHALSITHSPCVVISLLSGTTMEMLQKACGTKLLLRTHIRTQELTNLLSAADGDPQNESDDDAAVLPMPQHDALAMTAQHLLLHCLEIGGEVDSGSILMALPLARVLHELTLRLGRSSSSLSSHASETVAAVLLGHPVAEPSSTIGETPTTSTAECVGVTPSREEERSTASPFGWRASWTPMLQQLQQELRLK